MNLLNFFGNPLGDGVAVLAHEHHHYAEDGFVAAVRRRAGAKGVTDLNFRQVFHAQRHYRGCKFHR